MRLTIATTKEELDAAFQVRYNVFGEQGRYIDVKKYPGGRECDSFDTLDTTTNFIALDGDRGIATVRLLEKNPEVAERNSWDIGLDMEHLVDMSYYIKNGLNAAELPRSSVLKGYEKTGVMMNLWALAIQFARRRGVTHICALGNTETDDPRDSEIFYYSVKQMKLVHPHIKTPPREKIDNDSESRFRLYSEEDVERLGDLKDLDSKDLSGFGEPRVLHVFTKIGARYTGEPTLYNEFGRYAIPVALTLDELPETHPFNKKIDFEFDRYL